MRKIFILYKYDPKENSIVYIRSLSISSLEFTTSPAFAKRYNAISAFFLGLVYNFNWINEKHTTP
ncbi:MAG: hypothetical protein EOP53_04625 [Sphingobacteriales bacterium]|nr:MAG: hypothetical protein EOP53_04625 [Sphingobacteriales bacterium]